MKLSCVLLLALAPVNAVDSQPQAANLRGVASVALSEVESAPVLGDGIDFVEESSDKRRYGVPKAATCRGEAHWCATSPTPDQLKCCGSLVCQPDETVQSQSGVEDGKCVATTPDNGQSGPRGRAANNNGQVCQQKDDACSNKTPSPAWKCCNDGVTYNLVCNDYGGFFGRCVEATAPGEID
jgi:hypothetical protein